MIRPYGVLIAGLLAATQAAFAGELHPNVLVTTPPLKPYMDSLLTGIGSAQSLLRPGQNAHSFSLSPSQRAALAKADIIVIPDRGMNPLLDKLLTAEEKRGARVLELTGYPEASPLPYSHDNPWLRVAGLEDEPHEHDHPATDPHLWLDPVRMAALARPLAEGMGAFATSHRGRLLSNAEALERHLTREVTPGIADILRKTTKREGLHARPQVPFITYHAGYQYFFARFGLEPMGQITARPENYLGAQSLHDAMAGAGKLAIRCIITETENPLVQRVARASGARIVRLSPEGVYGINDAPGTPWAQNDYDRFLAKTAASFAACL